MSFAPWRLISGTMASSSALSPGIRERDQHVLLGDHAEVAVAGFRRVHEERRACRCWRGWRRSCARCGRTCPCRSPPRGHGSASTISTARAKLSHRAVPTGPRPPALRSPARAARVPVSSRRELAPSAVISSAPSCGKYTRMDQPRPVSGARVRTCKYPVLESRSRQRYQRIEPHSHHAIATPRIRPAAPAGRGRCWWSLLSACCNLPPLLGYLLVGIAIGPHALGLGSRH